MVALTKGTDMRKILLAAMIVAPALALAATENYDEKNGFIRPPGLNGGLIRFANNTTSVTLVQPDKGALCMKFDPSAGGRYAYCTDTSPSTVCGNAGFPQTTSSTSAWQTDAVNTIGTKVYMDSVHSSPTSVIYVQGIDSTTLVPYHWYTRCK